jgi:cytochrome c
MNSLYPHRPVPAASQFAHLAALLAAAFALAGCAPSGTDAATGKRLFGQCAECHAVGPNARGGFAPELNNLFGRHAGSTPDFAYSPAMKASGIVWNERTLATFLHDPGKLVPGTKMRFWGIGDERQIAALLAYLRTFQDPPTGKIDQATAQR